MYPIDFTFQSNNNLSVKSINEEILKNSVESFKGIIDYNTESLVSIDFNHNSASSSLTNPNAGGRDKFGRVLAWYDNEWGFSNRMIDVCGKLGSFYEIKTLDNLNLEGKKYY